MVMATIQEMNRQGVKAGVPPNLKPTAKTLVLKVARDEALSESDEADLARILKTWPTEAFQKNVETARQRYEAAAEQKAVKELDAELIAAAVEVRKARAELDKKLAAIERAQRDAQPAGTAYQNARAAESRLSGEIATRNAKAQQILFSTADRSIIERSAAISSQINN